MHKNRLKEYLLTFCAISLMMVITGCGGGGNWGEITSNSVFDEYIGIDYRKTLGGSRPNRDRVIKKEYDLYVFFLITNRKLGDNSEQAMDSLHATFKEFTYSKPFGRVGAIWPHHNGKPDIARSAWMAKLMGLDVAEGPFIVFIKPNKPKEITRYINYTKDLDTIRAKRQEIEDILKGTGEKLSMDFSDSTPQCLEDILSNIKVNIELVDDPGDVVLPVASYMVDCLVLEFVKKQWDRILEVLAMVKK